MPDPALRAETVRPLVVTSSAAVGGTLARVAAAAHTEPVIVGSAQAARGQWTGAPLVVVGDDLAAAIGGEVAAGRLRRRGGVVHVGVDLDDATVYARAVALGAEQVVFLPDAETWLVRRLSDALDGAPSAATVAAVIGGRGGAGATTLATALALAGRRQGAATLLVDADPLGGGIDLALGGEEVTGLRWPGLGGLDGRLSPAALRDALPAMRELSVLSWERSEGFELGPDAMQAVLDAAGRSGGLVVVDLPRRVDDVTRNVLDRADRTLLVVPAEVRATAAAGRVAAAVGQLTADLRVVVRGPSPAGLTARAVAGCLGLPLAGEVRAEPGLAAALERGDPPGRRARSPLGRLCDDLVAELLPAPGRAAAA